MRQLLFYAYKLTYQFNHWLGKRFTNNGLLILVLMPVSGVFGFNTRVTLSYQIFSITFILLIIAFCYAAFCRGRLSLKRILPDYATAGVPFTYQCEIHNNQNTEQRGLIVQDELATHFPDVNELKNSHDPLDKKRNRIDRILGYPRYIHTLKMLRGANIESKTIDFIAANKKQSIDVSITPLRRGYIQFSNINLQMIEPMGLLKSVKRHLQKDKLLVIPRRYRVPNLNLHGNRRYQQGGINQASQIGESQEFMSLRDYRPGDPLKTIHWRSFAKINKPVVKEFHDEYFVRYGLLLDTFLGNSNPQLFEEAISIAASYILKQQDMDSLIDLMFLGEKAYHISLGRGLNQADSALEKLACIGASRESNIKELEILLLQHINYFSSLIIILLDIDDDRMRLLKTIQSLYLPLTIFLIRSDELTSAEQINQKIHVIRLNSIQPDLDKIQFNA